jgi:hypothetical protein
VIECLQDFGKTSCPSHYPRHGRALIPPTAAAATLRPCLPQVRRLRHASWSSRHHLPASASLSCAFGTNAAARRTSVGTARDKVTKLHQAFGSSAQCKGAGATRLGLAETRVGAWGGQKRRRAASLHIMTSGEGCNLASSVIAGALFVSRCIDVTGGDATWRAHRAGV